MADIGTELRILFPPQTCLAIQVSAIFFFFCLPKFPSCSHFVSILTRITHVLYTHSSEGLDPTMAHSRKDKAKRHLEIKIQKVSESFMLCDGWIKYSKQLRKYIQSPTPSLFVTHAHHMQTEKLNIYVLVKNHIIIGQHCICCQRSWADYKGEKTHRKGMQMQLLKVNQIADLDDGSWYRKEEWCGVTGKTGCQMG